MVRDAETLHRIRAMAIPPAWTDVWICPLEQGHLQAVGRDARKRKQYRYHPRWREVRDATKFDRTGEDFTAKDFRTWAGTMLAVEALCECEAFTSKKQAKRNVVKAVETVAEKLGNTVTVCKKCYIHPRILEAYVEGSPALARSERALVRFLKRSK
jgi:DNA topoisomerase IB